MDFGLREFGVKDTKERLRYYRKFVYEKGGIGPKGSERKKDLELGAMDRFRYRTRYFTDSGIIGTKAFIARVYGPFKHHFASKHDKRPSVIRGLDGVYSLKRLSEGI